MSITTIRQLSLHQIEQLRAYFTLYTVETIGVVIETGGIIVEGTPLYSSAIQTKKIPLIDPNARPIVKIN
jgi:hypothetical protein